MAEIAIKNWVSAFRLKTLPLAFACILMGSFLAAFESKHNLLITILAIFTALLLQILSNLANDYGDWENGADLTGRIGPKRALQTGTISAKAMKRAVVIFASSSLVSGCLLLFVALRGNAFLTTIFLFLGILAILAAIKYTAGKNPYGYRALGDLAVLLFFGFLAVFGTYFLHTQTFSMHALLPAMVMGFLSVAVLNINNMRDIESDSLAKKMTIPVKIGLKRAKWYHFSLIFCAFCIATFHAILLSLTILGMSYLTVFIFFAIGLSAIFRKSGAQLEPHLKQTAIFTFILSIWWGLCLLYDKF